MNRADELALAWALADAATTFLANEARMQLCIQIGAGEQYGAIVDVLAMHVDTGTPLSAELLRVVDTWIGGYRGTDTGKFLRRILDEVRSTESTLRSRSAHAIGH